MFKCDNCYKTYKSRQALNNHIKNGCRDKRTSNDNNKRTRANEDQEYIPSPSSEEEDTSFDAIFAGGPSNPPAFSKKLEKAGAANGMPPGLDMLNIKHESLPVIGSEEEKKYMFNGIVQTIALDIEEKLRNEVSEDNLVDAVVKEIDTLDKARSYFDAASFMAGKELTMQKGDASVLKDSNIKQGVNTALYSTDLKYLENAVIELDALRVQLYENSKKQ